MANNNSKINNGCINIFKLLILLYSNDADYSKVVDIFKSDITVEDDYDEKKRNNLIQVVINKYINSLKVFGIKIIKRKNKYKLDSSFYKMQYTIQDLKAMSLIFAAGECIQDCDISQDLSDLKNNLFVRMSNDNKNTFSLLTTDNDFSFFYTDFKKQIDKCKNYIKYGFLLDLKYLKKNKEIRCKCKAIDILYDIKTAYFRVYDINKNLNIDIAIPNILSVSEYPNQAQPYINTKTIVYKLKGRLAKTYKLKPNEKLRDKNENEITIVNNNEPVDKLFSRLMRYSDLCEIISPKYLRQEMLNLLDETLNLYQ